MKRIILFHLFLLFGLFHFGRAGQFLRGTFNYSLNQEREKIINNYVNLYGKIIYDDIMVQMNIQKNQNTKNYSFYEFGCMPFSDGMKNTEITYTKNNDIDYSFKVYSCYSHFLALSLFKKDRIKTYKENKINNKNKINNTNKTNNNDYIPKNSKYNHFKYYYYEDIEMYSIQPIDIQDKMNIYLLDLLKKIDITLTISYEKCCRVYTFNW